MRTYIGAFWKNYSDGEEDGIGVAVHTPFFVGCYPYLKKHRIGIELWFMKKRITIFLTKGKIHGLR